MTHDPTRTDVPPALQRRLDALVADYGLTAVLGAALSASAEAGTPYGASTPVGDDGTLSGHGPCYHCGARQPSGEMWEADDGGVLCTVRCGACGRDYGEYYTMEADKTEAAQDAIG
jgi:hypothetical protein